MKLYLNHEYNNSSVVVEESVVVITKKKGDMYACIFEKNKKYCRQIFELWVALKSNHQNPAA